MVRTTMITGKALKEMLLRKKLVLGLLYPKQKCDPVWEVSCCSICWPPNSWRYQNWKARSILACLPGPKKTRWGLEMAICVWTGPVLKVGKMMNHSGPFFLFASGEPIPETADSILKYRLHPLNEPYLPLWRKTFLVLWEQCWTDKRVITLRQTSFKIAWDKFLSESFNNFKAQQHFPSEVFYVKCSILYIII